MLPPPFHLWLCGLLKGHDTSPLVLWTRHALFERQVLGIIYEMTAYPDLVESHQHFMMPGEKVLALDFPHVLTVGWSPRQVARLNLLTQEIEVLTRALPHPSPMGEVEWDPVHQRLLVNNTGQLSIMHLTGQVERMVEFDDPNWRTEGMTLHPPSDTVIVWDRYQHAGQGLICINVITGCFSHWPLHVPLDNQFIRTVAAHPAKHQLWLSQSDNFFGLFDDSGQCLFRCEAPQAYVQFQIVPEHNSVWAVTEHEDLHLLSETGAVIHQYPFSCYYLFEPRKSDEVWVHTSSNHLKCLKIRPMPL